MICIAAQDIQAIKRTSLSPLLYPSKLLPYRRRGHAFSIQTFHLLALTANDRRIQARVQVVFVDSDSRLFRIDAAQVEEGADLLAKMATGAFLSIDADSHR